MATAELSVQLTANIKELEKALGKVQKDLKDTAKVADSSTKQISNTGNKAARGINKIGKASANATPTLQEFSRVIQDAPFGIQGVGNNITQLVSSFGNLQRATGSTSSAFKALLGSFIGPAGILFAVSTVVSLLTVYGDRLFKTASGQRELADATKSYAGSAQAEISTIQSLLRVVQDETATREKRAQAVQVLQNKYPNYLSNLSQENATTDKIRESVQNLTRALEERAKVQGAQALITKKAEELFLAQTQAQERYQKALDAIPGTLASQQQAYGQYSRGIQRAAFNRDAAEARLQKNASDRLKETLSEAQAEYQKYVSNLSKILSGAPNLLDAFGVSTSGGSKKASNVIAKQVTDPLDAIFAFDPAKLSGRAKILENFVSGSIKSIGNAANKAANQTLEQLNLIDEKFAAFAEQSIENTLANFAASIGNALASGGNVIQSGGAALLGAIGQVAVDLGKMVIAQGIAIEAVKTALKSLNGVFAIAAGTALVAIGSAFKSGASRLAGAAGGGNSFSGAGGGSGSFSGASSSVSSFNGGGEVVFRIAGTDLVGVLSRQLDKNKRLGSNLAF